MDTFFGGIFSIKMTKEILNSGLDPLPLAQNVPIQGMKKLSFWIDSLLSFRTKNLNFALFLFWLHLLACSRKNLNSLIIFINEWMNVSRTALPPLTNSFTIWWVFKTHCFSGNSYYVLCVLNPKIINTRYVKMLKSTDINSLLQLISTCEIDTKK